MDHDYTKSTSPSKIDKIKEMKNWNTPKPRGKENRALPTKKTSEIDSCLPLDKRKNLATLPNKYQGTTTVPFRPRNQMEEYNVMYSFLIKGKTK